MVDMQTDKKRNMIIIAIALIAAAALAFYLLPQLGQLLNLRTGIEQNQTIQTQNETPIVVQYPETEPAQRSATSVCNVVLEAGMMDNYTYEQTYEGEEFVVTSELVIIPTLLTGDNTDPVVFNVTARKTMTAKKNNAAQPIMTEYVLLDRNLACYLTVIESTIRSSAPCSDSSANYTKFRYCTDDFYGKTNTQINVPLGTFYADEYKVAGGGKVWFARSIAIPLKIDSGGAVSELMSYSKG